MSWALQCSVGSFFSLAVRTNKYVRLAEKFGFCLSPARTATNTGASGRSINAVATVIPPSNIKQRGSGFGTMWKKYGGKMVKRGQCTHGGARADQQQQTWLGKTVGIKTPNDAKFHRAALVLSSELCVGGNVSALCIKYWNSQQRKNGCNRTQMHPHREWWIRM